MATAKITTLMANLMQTTDVVTASNASLKLRALALKNNSEAILALRSYVSCGFSTFAQRLAIRTLVDIATPNSHDYYAEFIAGLNFRETDFIAIEGLLKTIGEEAYPLIVKLIESRKEEPRDLYIIVLKLAAHANQDFLQGMPDEPKYWTTDNLPLEKILSWAASGYPRGSGAHIPEIDENLVNPKTEFQKTLKSLDDKLAKLRQADSYFSVRPTNLLTVGNKKKIDELAQIYKLPQYYIEFLSYCNPYQMHCNIKSPSGLNDIVFYNAENLLEEQSLFYGVQTNPKSDYLHIGQTASDPICAIAMHLPDISGADFAVYVCDSEEPGLIYKRINKSFMSFLSSLRVSVD